jgi:hypothetical protein
MGTFRRSIGVAISLACGCATGGGASAPVGPAGQGAATEPTVIRAAIEWPLVLERPGTPATHRAAVFELLEVSGANTAMASMADVALVQLMATQPALKDYEGIMRDFFGRYLTVEAMSDELAKLYMSRFTELQLRQMTAFYRTPTGKLAVRELPLLVQEGANIGKLVVERHQAELKDLVMKEFQRRNP